MFSQPTFLFKSIKSLAFNHRKGYNSHPKSNQYHHLSSLKPEASRFTLIGWFWRLQYRQKSRATISAKCLKHVPSKLQLPHMFQAKFFLWIELDRWFPHLSSECICICQRLSSCSCLFTGPPICIMRAVLLLGNTHVVHEEKYMYKFYAVQRWSSYAYSAVNLKVGGVYLIVMLFTNCSFCRRIFCVWCEDTSL